MKKSYLFFLLLLLSATVGFGQCTTSITLSSQSEIDNFVANYGCTTITGSLQISGSDITNLDGLSQITAITGTLYVYSNPVLTTVSFPALTTVGDLAVIFDNPVLATIDFPNLTSFGNAAYITENATLSAINFPALTNVTGYLELTYLPALTSIDFPLLTTVGSYLTVSNHLNLAAIGFPSLTSVGGFLTIGTNPGLTSLSGLASVTSVVGLDINNNPGLTDLTGIENINPATLTSLNIYSNTQLTTCNTPNICSYILNGGSNYVVGNAPKCATTTQIKVSCGVPQNCDYITLYTQVEIDNFPINYGCSSISGFLTITGNDITNLNGLAQLLSVGNLNIADVPNLTDYSGLDGLTTITGSFSLTGTTAASITAFPNLIAIDGHFGIQSTSLLESFTGFQNLTTIGGDLNVYFNNALTQLPPFIHLSAIGTSSIGGQGFLTIIYNPVLQNVNSLSALTSIDGNFQISNNDALTSIEGIKNIDPQTINELRIGNNPLLALCNVDSVCEYLSVSGNYYEISGNAPGCENVSVVLASCIPNCPSEDVFLSTQALVDAFGSAYTNCTSLDVNLTISGADITNIDALSRINFVSGNVTVTDNPFLISLHGLHNIASISGTLKVNNNDVLTDMSGLGALTTVGGPIQIDDNALLLSLDGLSGIVNVVEELKITNNNSLEDLTGLSNLASVPFLIVSGNNNLTNLQGLNNLADVSEIEITHNTMLNDLTALESLPNTLASLNIRHNTSLVTLTGLSNLQSVNILNIGYNDALTNLSGLENLTAINELDITGNDVLVDLTALSSVTGVLPGGMSNRIIIWGNNSLTTLEGLNGIQSTPVLRVNYNPVLVDVSGLNGLQSVGRLNIEGNDSLNNIDALSNLLHVGEIEITLNGQLESIMGLNNLLTIGSIQINENPNLTTCNAAGICTYLSNGEFATIYNNATGCDTTLEVQYSCNTGNQCPGGDIEFLTQAQVDDFILHYPTCTVINGNVSISVGSVANVNGLRNITTINGDLTIGLNHFLNDLTGLSSLTTVTGTLTITQNNALFRLSGLDNLNPETLGHLVITNCPNLSYCNVESICRYIDEYSGTASISGNAAGCNSRTELLDMCSNSVIISLKAFVEGYYEGAETMRPVRFNQDGLSPLTQVKPVQVTLHEAFPPYEMADRVFGMLQTDGTLTCRAIPLNGHYYIVVRGDNFIATWSAVPVMLGEIPAFYDFTTAQDKAYGNNMVQLEPGVFGFYSGDLNQDGFVDGTDYSLWETDYNNFAYGVYATDLNGDGFVDGTDYSLWEGNYNNFIYSVVPE